MATKTEVAHRLPEGRLPGLDGLRAIAVLLVLFAHFFRTSATGSILGRVAQTGVFGVEVFFVLSGFLITYLLLIEEEAEGYISLRLFYARRALRILPPLLFLLLVLAVASIMGVVNIPVIDFFAGLFFFRNYVGTSAETGHLWTLAIEEQFYLLWPIALVLIKSRRLRIAFTSGFIALSPFWRQLSYHLAGGASAVNGWRTDLRLEPLAIGALLSLLLTVPRTRAVLARPLVRGFWAISAAFTFLVCQQRLKLHTFSD